MQIFLVSLASLKDSNRCLHALITTLIGRLLALAKFDSRARLEGKKTNFELNFEEVHRIFGTGSRSWRSISWCF